jgi:hypothetical protein
MRILDSDESRQLYGIIAVFSTRGKTALNNHIFGETHLEPQDFEDQVRLLQQGLALLGVLGLDQGLQKVIEVAFDAFAEDEAVIAGEFAGVIAGPQDQVIRLRDDRQFLVVLSV